MRVHQPLRFTVYRRASAVLRVGKDRAIDPVFECGGGVFVECGSGVLGRCWEWVGVDVDGGV